MAGTKRRLYKSIFCQVLFMTISLSIMFTWNFKPDLLINFIMFLTSFPKEIVVNNLIPVILTMCYCKIIFFGIILPIDQLYVINFILNKSNNTDDKVKKS